LALLFETNKEHIMAAGVTARVGGVGGAAAAGSSDLLSLFKEELGSLTASVTRAVNQETITLVFGSPRETVLKNCLNEFMSKANDLTSDQIRDIARYMFEATRDQDHPTLHLIFMQRFMVTILKLSDRKDEPSLTAEWKVYDTVFNTKAFYFKPDGSFRGGMIRLATTPPSTFPTLFSPLVASGPLVSYFYRGTEYLAWEAFLEKYCPIIAKLEEIRLGQTAGRKTEAELSVMIEEADKSVNALS